MVNVAAPVPGLLALTALGLPWAVLVASGPLSPPRRPPCGHPHVGLLNGLGLAALLASGTGGGSGYHWAAAGVLAALGVLAGATAAELPGDAGWPPALRTLFDNATRPPTARTAVLAQAGLGMIVPGALIFAVDVLRTGFGLGPRGAVGVIGDALLAGAALAVLLRGERALRLAVAAAPAGLLVAAGALSVGATVGVVLFASGLAVAVGALVALAVSGERIAAEVLHPDARPAFVAATSVLSLAGGPGGAGLLTLLNTRYGAGPALAGPRRRCWSAPATPDGSAAPPPPTPNGWPGCSPTRRRSPGYGTAAHVRPLSPAPASTRRTVRSRRSTTRQYASATARWWRSAARTGSARPRSCGVSACIAPPPGWSGSAGST